MRRYRARRRAGRAFVPVVVDAARVSALARRGFLPAGRDAVSRAEIGAAIEALLDRIDRD